MLDTVSGTHTLLRSVEAEILLELSTDFSAVNQAKAQPYMLRDTLSSDV